MRCKCFCTLGVSKIREERHCAWSSSCVTSLSIDQPSSLHSNITLSNGYWSPKRERGLPASATFSFFFFFKTYFHLRRGTLSANVT
jgi:hypothetical protein